MPLVGVDVWYHVGPAHEAPGRTGFAHLFEHMMFQGSKHIESDAHFKLLAGGGATGVNGTTNFDRTNYFETMPRISWSWRCGSSPIAWDTCSRPSIRRSLESAGRRP